MSDGHLPNRLAGLARLNKSELCSLWKEQFDSGPPSGMRRNLLLRIVAQQVQVNVCGGLSITRLQQLRRLMDTFQANPNAAVSSRPPIKPGTRLIRQWKNQVHVVNVEEQGYEYQGDHYLSLSQIARIITGTRWSGPLFFGLKAKSSVASMRAR